MHYDGGLKAFINHINKSKAPLHESVISLTGEDKNIQVKCFMEMCIARGELVRSELNQQISTPDGEFIGANINEAISYFKNPNNAGLKTKLENKLKLI